MAIRMHLSSLRAAWSATRLRRDRDRDAKPNAIWDLEPGSPEFSAEMRWQALAANESPHAEDDLAFVESVSVLTERRSVASLGQENPVRTIQV